MNGFIDNAVQILEAAENVMTAGETPSEFSILLGVDGGIRMVAGCDWPLESLQREYGARMAYRVTPHADRVSVDGMDHSRTCHFETAAPAQTARLLLNSFPNWHSCPSAPAYAQ